MELFARLGGKTLDQEGYDLMGLICGSEGLLGVVTEVTVKILKKPQVVKAALLVFLQLKKEEMQHQKLFQVELFQREWKLWTKL